MKNLILIGSLIVSTSLVAENINLKIDEITLGESPFELHEFNGLKCKNMYVVGETTLANPNRVDEDPGSVVVECDSIHFSEDAVLKTKSHLQLRAKSIKGSVRILGQRENINGKAGVSQASYKPGRDGTHGAAGGNGVDARAFRGAENGARGVDGGNGTGGGHGIPGGHGEEGKKNVTIDIRADGFEKDTILIVESRGGRGGNGGAGSPGGNGGNGGNGGIGGKGGDANAWLGQSAGNGGSGGNAGNGGNGGNGGDAGQGGKGGDGGDIYILINAPGGQRPGPEFIPRRSPLMDNIGGNGGTAGVQGIGGKGGRAGAPGAGGARGQGEFWNDDGDQGPFGRTGIPGEDGKPGRPGLPGEDGERGTFSENITGFYDNTEIKSFNKSLGSFEVLNWRPLNRFQLLD